MSHKKVTIKGHHEITKEEYIKSTKDTLKVNFNLTRGIHKDLCGKLTMYFEED